MRGLARGLRALQGVASTLSSVEGMGAASGARSFSLFDSLTGVKSTSSGKWPPKDPQSEYLRTKERIDIVLRNNPLPKERPWELDHHDDHGHGDHGHGHGHDDGHGHGYGKEDNPWYEPDSLVDPHEPPATRENPSLVGPYIRAFEEDGVWVVEKDRDPTLEEEVRFRVMKLLTYFDEVDPNKIRRGSRFMEDLGLDSLDVVELQMAIEEEFGVQIPDDLAERLWSVDDAVHVLCNEERVWGPYKEENIQKWADWYWHHEGEKGRSGW